MFMWRFIEDAILHWKIESSMKSQFTVLSQTRFYVMYKLVFEKVPVLYPDFNRALPNENDEIYHDLG